MVRQTQVLELLKRDGSQTKVKTGEILIGNKKESSFSETD